jgi:hypothetical protein
MAGFGLAAWNVNGALFAAGMEGAVYRLTDDLQQWIPVAELACPRFFHQFVPDGRGNLLAVAGASPEEGHLATIECVELKP